jgi:hypothetical protein
VVLITACGDVFHLICLLTWFQSSAARHCSCPMCRRKLLEAEANTGIPSGNAPVRRSGRAIHMVFQSAMNHPSGNASILRGARALDGGHDEPPDGSLESRRAARWPEESGSFDVPPDSDSSSDSIPSSSPDQRPLSGVREVMLRGTSLLPVPRRDSQPRRTFRVDLGAEDQPAVPSLGITRHSPLRRNSENSRVARPEPAMSRFGQDQVPTPRATQLSRGFDAFEDDVSDDGRPTALLEELAAAFDSRYASLIATERRSSFTSPSMAPAGPRLDLHLPQSPTCTPTSPMQDPPSPPSPSYNLTSPQYGHGFLGRPSTLRRPSVTSPAGSRHLEYSSRNSPTPPYSRTSPTFTRTSVFAPTPTSPTFRPTSPGISPTSPQHSPTSPQHSPTSPILAPSANTTWGRRQASPAPAYVASRRVRTVSPVNSRASNSPGWQSASSYLRDSNEDPEATDESA